MDIFSSIGPAIAGIKSLTEIASMITDVKIRQELNGKIADLQGALISTRQQILDMQEQYEEILRENKLLKEASAPRGTPKLLYGCYKFEGEEGLFCPACYDSKGKKFRASRMNANFYQCTVCRAVLA